MAGKRGPDVTPAQEEEFLNLVRMGMYPAQAARKVGLAKSTMSQRKKSKHFAAKMEEAEAAAEAVLVAFVFKAGKTDWRAAMGILERRFPERWARPEIRNEITNVNVSAAEVASAIHAGLAKLAERHAPPGQPDVEDTEKKLDAT